MYAVKLCSQELQGCVLSALWSISHSSSQSRLAEVYPPVYTSECDARTTLVAPDAPSPPTNTGRAHWLQIHWSHWCTGVTIFCKGAPLSSRRCLQWHPPDIVIQSPSKACPGFVAQLHTPDVCQRLECGSLSCVRRLVHFLQFQERCTVPSICILYSCHWHFQHSNTRSYNNFPYIHTFNACL